MFTCPMHPDVTSEKPGRCPKCGMKLVEKGSHEAEHSHHSESKTSWKDYTPLIVVIKIILLTTIVLAIRDSQMGQASLSNTISYFMIGFFLTFSGFKFMDLKGFAEGYSTYDLIAKRWFTYGYIYPFIELFFGLAMILIPQARWLLWSELIIMSVSGLGVALKLMRHEKFQCACLGTFLKVPLTKVTLVEDFGMAALALIMLML